MDTNQNQLQQFFYQPQLFRTKKSENLLGIPYPFLGHCFLSNILRNRETQQFMFLLLSLEVILFNYHIKDSLMYLSLLCPNNKAKTSVTTEARENHYAMFYILTVLLFISYH